MVATDLRAVAERCNRSAIVPDLLVPVSTKMVPLSALASTYLYLKELLQIPRRSLGVATPTRRGGFQTISVKLTPMRLAGRSAATKISNESIFEVFTRGNKQTPTAVIRSFLESRLIYLKIVSTET